MSISVTKNQQQNSFNPTKWALAGAAAGYVAKDFMPITKAEKEYYEFDEFIIDRKKTVKSAVDEELEKVRNIIKEGSKDKGYNVYLEYVKIGKKQPERDEYLAEIQKMPAKVRATFERLRKQVDEKVREIKRNHEIVFNSVVKNRRPVAVFAIVGAMAATGVAFVSYALSKMSSK